jgi:outer membrane protein OmpA-like peptidoglycan-associated protein
MKGVLIASVVALGLAGCASGRVSLFEDAPGVTGAVAVFDGKTEAERGVLDQPNTQAALGGRTLQPRPISPAPYADLLARMPPAPRAYVLYFKEGSTDLTDESRPILAALRQVVEASSEVQITGHTDTVGEPELNDGLSRDRATEIRAALVRQGLPVENARVTGRGERELRVPTADGVSEPANRRVEVILR